VAHTQSRQGPAAGERRQRAGQPAAMVGLLVGEILRVEQYPGRVTGPLRGRPRVERVGIGRA
jgi:hypothetical protein